ncbi:MAG: glycosyltransferase family 2 protein [Candidatus Bathyarchaeota archaeon]
MSDVLAPPPRIALVVPCYNEEECLLATIATLGRLLDRLAGEGTVAADSFLYLVDDGSSDRTWTLIATAHAADPRVRGLRLSRNFGHQNALLAGLKGVMGRCDASISIDADLQQDPEAIPAFVDAYRRGAEVVLGVRSDRRADGWFKGTTARLFYRLMAAMGVGIVPNHADYRLLGAQAMAALAEYRESNLFLRYICCQLGFRTETVSFEVRPRLQGESKYSLAKMLRLALHGITSSSVVPLRLVAVTGFVIFLLSAVMGGYVLYRTLAVGDTVPGWASTTLPIYFIGGIQLLCLGVVGEYVGQIFGEVKRRPHYLQDHELF